MKIKSTIQNKWHYLKFEQQQAAGGFMSLEAKTTFPNLHKTEIKHQCHRCFCVAAIYKINMFSSKDPQTH